MEMTTGTDIICPNCQKEIDIITEGLLGGLLKQMFISAAIERAKKEGITITCPCGHEFELFGSD